jgi:hypothetical protein
LRERLRYAAMQSKTRTRTLILCFFCGLLCAACSGRKVVARYEGIDPRGRPVDAVLYIPPFDAFTPVCLAAADPAAAEVKLIAQPPTATRRITYYLSRKHYSQCGAEIFASVVYWETTALGPEVCLYRSASAEDAQVGSEVAGAWDYCTRLHPHRD